MSDIVHRLNNLKAILKQHNECEEDEIGRLTPETLATLNAKIAELRQAIERIKKINESL